MSVISKPPVTGIYKHTTHKAPFTANGVTLPLVYDPKLPAIPTVPNELSRKATLTGVTYLKTNSYRTRLTGNKQCATDIHGHLWLKGSELTMALKGTPVTKKVPRVETQGSYNFFTWSVITSANIHKNQAPTASLAIFLEVFITIDSQNGKNTPPKEPRQYSIKKQVVRQRLLNYINTQNGRKQLFFFTVTFPKDTPDDIAYKIYNIWLTSLRKYGMLKDYLWIAERQPQTGTVHFHIAIPHYMDVRKANAMMAGTLKTFARRGDIPFSVHACRKYNGVDIAKHRTTKRVVNFAIKKGGRALGNYLTKYITKNDGTFTHLAWHNSRGFSSVFTGITFTKSEFQKNGLWKHLDFSRQRETEHAIFVPWKGNPPPVVPEFLYSVNSYIQSQNLN